MDEGRVTTGAIERSTASLDAPGVPAADLAAPADVPAGAGAGAGPAGRPSRRRLRLPASTWRQATAVVVVVAVVAGAAATQWKASEARRGEAEARAGAAETAGRRDRIEAEVDDRLVSLEAAYLEASEATAAREAQRDRLVELQLAEETLEEVVAEARRDTASVEAERDGLDDQVREQSIELPRLEGCLAEVRPLLDTAFLATVNPGLTVPSISPACRALLDAVGGRA